jgi:tetratricopeptide (TPR) repeat protein
MKRILSTAWILLCGSGMGILCQLPAWGISSVEAGKIAKAITISINPESNNAGSGVIIQKQGNSYTILTSGHVVRNSPNPSIIVTPDGKKHQLKSVKIAQDKDLAAVTFESSSNYSVIKLGDAANSSEGSIVYVSGFPVATKAIGKSVYNFTEGKVKANANQDIGDGYSLVYSNSTLPGMSGGPVLNNDGELIAIHGRGDSKEVFEQSEINPNVIVKTGFNSGITITTFLKLANSLGVKLGSDTPIVVTRLQTPKADDFFIRGIEAFRKSNWSVAIEMMEKATQADPKYLRAYLVSGAANFMENRISNAVNESDKAIAIDSNYALGHMSKCYFLGELKQFSRALDHCNRAIEISPNSSISYNVRGLVKGSLNDLNGAEGDLLQSIKLDPKSYYAYGNLSVLYSARNNLPVALQYAQQAVKVHPDSALARVQLAQVLVLSNNYQQAIIEADRSIRINPRISAAYNVRAIASLSTGNFGQAQQDAQTAQTLAQSSPQGAIEDLSFLSQ